MTHVTTNYGARSTNGIIPSLAGRVSFCIHPAKKRNELIGWLALSEDQKQKTPCPILSALLPAWLKEGPHGLPVEVTEAARFGKHIKKVPAKTVVRIFELAAEGFGARTILEKLNDGSR
jgi:hypothetical protein